MSLCIFYFHNKSKYVVGAVSHSYADKKHSHNVDVSLSVTYINNEREKR